MAWLEGYDFFNLKQLDCGCPRVKNLIYVPKHILGIVLPIWQLFDSEEIEVVRC